MYLTYLYIYFFDEIRNKIAALKSVLFMDVTSRGEQTNIIKVKVALALSSIFD